MAVACVVCGTRAGEVTDASLFLLYNISLNEEAQSVNLLGSIDLFRHDEARVCPIRATRPFGREDRTNGLSRETRQHSHEAAYGEPVSSS